jgi:regulator of sigma E protease
MHEFLVSIVAFIVLVGVMVIVHELGHFAVAKACGVRVEAFSFGFGPKLFGFTHGETEYKVCLLPLGGFVKMTGEAPEQNLEAPGSEQKSHEDDPGAFTSHPRWQRMLIGLAGPAANFLLALVLMLVYYGFINEVPSVQVNSTAVEWVTPNSAAAEAGIEAGDVVQSFDGAQNPEWFPQVYEHVKLNPGQFVPVTVLRAGQPVNLTLHIPAAAKDDDFDISDTGIQPQFLPGPIQVTEVQAGTPAAAAGLKAGDGIVSVDGHPFHSVTTLIAYMQAGKGQPINLVVARNGAQIPMIATPAKLDTGYKIGFATVPPPYRAQPLSLVPAFRKSLAFCKENSWVVFAMLDRLFTHRASVTQLVGPIGIARVAGEAAEMHGWLPKFNLAGMISLNLGILNLLPFPILDGGMILLLLIESIIRHDISARVKERIYQAAFVVLMAFFVFIIFNDMSRLPLFSHLRP